MATVTSEPTIIKEENVTLVKEEIACGGSGEIPESANEQPKKNETPIKVEAMDVAGPSNSTMISESPFNKANEWLPTSRLGRMVKSGKYSSIEEIRRNKLIIREVNVVKFLLGPALKYYVFHVTPIFDKDGNRRGYTSLANCGDSNGHVGYSVKYDPSHEVSGKGAIDRSINNIIAINRFCHTNKNQKFFTVGYKVVGESGKVTVRLLPSFSGGIKCANLIIHQMLSLAGIDNCVVEFTGGDFFIGNMALATYNALQQLEIE